MSEDMKSAILKAVLSMVAGLVSASVMSAYDVDSVCVWTVMTKDEVIAHFGEPDRYIAHDSEFGLDEWYYYGESILVFAGNEFVGFYIDDSRFPVLKHSIPGGVRIGDPFEVLAPLSPYRTEWRGEGIYALFYYSDFPVYVKVVDEKINWIHFTMPM